MTEATRVDPRDNVVFGVIMGIAVLLMLISATVVTLRDHPDFSLEFATGGSCYMSAHHSVCR